MFWQRRFRAAWMLLVFSACVFPTDRANQFQLVLDPIPDMFVGDTFPLTARFAGQPPPGTSTDDFLFVSSDPAVGIITPQNELIAVGTGPALISVRVRFADIPPTERVIVVNTGVRVDSAVPQTVIFGDTMRIYGLGLNPALTTVTFSGVRPLVQRYDRAVPTSANGLGVLTVVVIPPAGPSARITATGARGATTSPFSVLIEQRDRFEPNGSTPAHLGTLRGQLNEEVLALEATGVSDSALNRDWYTFTNPVAQTVRIVLRMDAPVSADEILLAVADSLTPEGFARPDRWLVGSFISYCRGTVVRGRAVPADSQVLELNLPAGINHVQVQARAPLIAGRRYGLSIQEGGGISKSEDEDNDHCFAASGHLPPPRPVGQVQVWHGQWMNHIGDVDWYHLTLGERTRIGFFVGDPGPVPVSDGRFPLVEIFTNTADLQHVAGGVLDPAGGVPTQFEVVLEPGRYFVVASDAFGLNRSYFIVLERRSLSETTSGAEPR